MMHEVLRSKSGPITGSHADYSDTTSYGRHDSHIRPMPMLRSYSFSAICMQRSVVMLATLIAMLSGHGRAAAQYNSDVFTLKSQQELYDERGFLQNKAISVDGRLMAATSNGNIAYSYPISKFVAGGHEFEVALNYCGSVEFTTFKSYGLASRHNNTYRGWNRFQQNRPAWVMGINGFAINVISSSIHFRNDPDSRVFKPASTDLDDRDFIWSIEGYDFSNRMFDMDPADQHDYYNDEIRILRSDGSVMKLVNAKKKNNLLTHESDKRPELYTGYYFVNEANTHQYGYVEYDSTYWVPRRRELDTTLSEAADRRCPLIPRKLHFYPGDGLEYVFMEWTTPYGMLPFRTVDTLSGGIYAHPTIFYLEEIRSNVGEIMRFTRTRHYPYIARGLEPIWEDSTRGRAIITAFHGHNISFGYNSMMIEAVGRTTTVKFNTIKRSGNAESWETMEYANNGSLTQASLQTATWPETRKELYKSFVGYVSEIIDPEGRKTTFGYEPYTRVYKKYDFPNPDAEMTLGNYRLNEIVEPTAKYQIYYHGATSMDVNRFSTIYDYALNNMADSVVKRTLDGVRLTSDCYKFPAYGGGVTSPEQRSWDWITGKLKTTTFSYSQIGLQSNVPGVPAPKFTTMPSVSEVAGDHSSTTSTTYTNSFTTPSGGSVTLTYLHLPETETKSEGHVGSAITKSHLKYSYVVDSVRNFIPDSIPKLRYSWEVMKKIVKQCDPSDYDRVLRTDTIEYVHRNPTDTTVIWAEHRWDKFATYQNYFYLRDTVLDSLVINTFCEKLIYWPPVGVFIDVFDTSRVLVPPQYGMEQRRVSYDEDGTLIEGKKNVYLTRLKVGYYRDYLGALIADTVIGRGGRTMLNGTYEYTGGWGAYLPMNVKNALGSNVLYSYSPWFCWNYGVAQWDTCINDNLPTMSRLTSDGSIMTDLFQGSSMGGWFGKPLGEANMVRKYVLDGGSLTLLPRPIFTFTEHSFYGTTSGTLDPNGWYSKFDYDRNGRLRGAWLPSDFPLDTFRPKGPSDTLYYQSVESLGFAGNTYFNRRIDTLRCWTDYVSTPEVDRSEILNGNIYTTWIPDTLIASRPVTVEPECARPTTRSGTKRGDGGQTQMLFVGKTPFDDVVKCPTCEGYVAQLEHYMGGASPLANVVDIDSVYVEFTLATSGASCTDVRITCPQIGLSKLYLFGCTAVKPVSVGSTNRKTGDGGSLQDTGSAGSRIQRLRINLSSFRSQIMAQGPGGRLTFKIKTSTPGAVVQFIQGMNGEDTRPRLVVGGRFRKVRTNDRDYTLLYAYNDKDLISTVRAKIDDSATTSNRYDFFSRPIRKTYAEHQFGADGRLLESKIDHTFPSLDVRTDYVQHEYNGMGLKTKTIDQENDETSVEYDDAGRPVKTVNGDGTFSTIGYYYNTPSAFGITDQDLFGFCMARTMTDENGTKSVQYTDPFGRLRREIADSGASGTHLNLTTKYDYDIFGRLAMAINPKGDTTKYYYDDFGRVRYKYHPDMGTMSYAYDPAGNVRFTQSQEQARNSLLSFNQYDDMKRLVVAGEAKIGGESLPDSNAPYRASPSLNRLTDRFDPNILHDSVSGYLTASKTLWMTPEVSVPGMFARKDLDSSDCSFGAEPLLGEEKPPVGWLLRHTVQYHNPIASSAPKGSFEHIAKYPEFVRLAIGYDTLPMTVGAVWKDFPAHERWDSLAPRGKVRNLIGREAAVAYREHSGEPFHYAVMSYDERGRVEALLRYTENLGFDAVYYTYNAMNKVVTVRVADPLRQYTTWYGHDENGRVDSVWTKLSALWSGLGVKRPVYPAPETRPALADIVYRYNKTGRVDSMQYDPVSVLVTYAYNHRKWLDSIVADQSGSPLFKQVLGYDSTGQILSQRWQHGSSGAVTHTYGYDSVGRLTRWFDGTDTTKYGYDAVGNRLLRLKTGGTVDNTTLTYGAGGSNRLSQAATTVGVTSRTTSYTYDRDGAVTGMFRLPVPGNATRDSLVYSWRDLTRQYLHYGIGAGSTITTTEDWRYRYNAMGEREQKRLYLQLDSNHNPVAGTPWVYYLLGGSREQLAVYHGQEKMLTGCSDSFSVYMYPSEYNTFGVMYPGIKEDIAHVTTLPNVGNPAGVKEYKITDHLASTRVVVTLGQPARTYDYEPYGGLLASTTGAETRQGFNGREDDRESGAFNLGVRQYEADDDEDGGRFRSVDPLASKFPQWSPYVYGNGNPLRYTDPDGKQGRISNPEFALATWHPYAAYVIYQNSDKAARIAFERQQELGGGIRNGPADAFRHALWSAMNARDVGVVIARQFGNAHEEHPDNPLAEKNMDLHNNNVGYEIGRTNPGSDDAELVELVEDALVAHRLQIDLYASDVDEKAGTKNYPVVGGKTDDNDYDGDDYND